MIDILVGANRTYVQQERGVNGAAEILPRAIDVFAQFQPFSGALGLLALMSALRSRGGIAWRRYAVPMLLALATFAAVVMQLKFYLYHYGALAVVAAVLFALLWEDVRAALRGRGAWAPPAAFVGAVSLAFLFSGGASERWFLLVRDTIRHERGLLSSEEYSTRYDIPGFYSYHDALLVGDWLREHSSPDDTVVVRGFEPEIYAISGRHFTGRFFWTTFLTEPRRVYRREALLAEDRAAIEAHPPRYAVALNLVHEGVDSDEWFEERGYVRRVDIGGFSVLERPPVERQPR
jgi:hypothetical protein